MKKPLATCIPGVILLFIVLTLLSCGDGGGSGGGAPVLTSIGITPRNQVIVKGTTQQFVATGTFSDGTTQDITAVATWSSSDVTKATVSNADGSKGLATGAGIGSTTITATSRGISGKNPRLR